MKFKVRLIQTKTIRKEDDNLHSAAGNNMKPRIYSRFKGSDISEVATKENAIPHILLFL